MGGLARTAVSASRYTLGVHPAHPLRIAASAPAE
jgi:hypothetical protein